MTKELYSFRVTFEADVSTGSYHEPDEFVTDWTARIFAMDERDERKEIGDCCFSIIDLDAAFMDGTPLLEVFDCHSQELMNLYEGLFDLETESIRPEVLGSGLEPSKVLYLKSAKVEPAFRGTGVGLVVVDTILRHFGGCDTLAVLEGSPLKEDIEAPTDRMGQGKLRRHWAKLGFTRATKTSRYMTFHTENRRPSLKQALGQKANFLVI